MAMISQPLSEVIRTQNKMVKKDEASFWTTHPTVTHIKSMPVQSQLRWKLRRITSANVCPRPLIAVFNQRGYD